MQENDIQRPRYAIIGGGISGLAAAHRLTELDAQVELRVFESKDRLGGVLQTRRQDGFLIEESADNFITNLPQAVDLCRRVGMEDLLAAIKEEKTRGESAVDRWVNSQYI